MCNSGSIFYVIYTIQILFFGIRLYCTHLRHKWLLFFIYIHIYVSIISLLIQGAATMQHFIHSLKLSIISHVRYLESFFLFYIRTLCHSRIILPGQWICLGTSEAFVLSFSIRICTWTSAFPQIGTSLLLRQISRHLIRNNLYRNFLLYLHGNNRTQFSPDRYFIIFY